MNIPFALRWALAMAALRGAFKQAAVQMTADGAEYRFAVSSEVAKPWVQRRESRRQLIREGEQQAAQRIRGTWAAGLSDDAEPAFEDPVGTLEKIHDVLTRIEDRD